MGLTQPVVLGTVGPTYASEINSDLDLVDQHDHSSGKGVPVTTAGLNVNADLSFNSNAALSVQQVGMTDVGSPLSSSLLDRVYFSGGELFVNDGSGNQVQITLGGAVNTGSTGNISGLTSPASASYSSVTKTFTWAQAASQAAHMSMASAILHRGAAPSENSITLTPPVSVPSSYTITLPGAAPGSTLPLSMDSSGNVAPAQITTAQIASGAVTAPKSGLASTFAAVNTSTLSSTSFADIAGASVTGVVCTGGLMMFALVPTGSATLGGIEVTTTSTAGSFAQVQLMVDGVATSIGEVGQSQNLTANWVSIANNVVFMVGVAAGTHDFKLQYKVTGAGCAIQFRNLAFIVKELF